METTTIDEPKPKIKHDWYQTETHVVVTIFAKCMKNLKIDYGECTLNVSGNLPSGDEYSLKLNLARFIVTEQCSYKETRSMIEIKLKKQEGIRWINLEGDPILCNVKPIPIEPKVKKEAPEPPSSCKESKNWDKLEKEIVAQDAKELSQGEAAVNALFQDIYGKGTDEVRRAMNKSYIESGGTVLSTNWEEVGQKTVQRKPPDGMEWKSWNKE